MHFVFTLIQGIILSICSLSITACSEKQKESTLSSDYQIRVLQKNEAQEFQSRNLSDELNLTDIIYLDKNKGGVLKYNSDQVHNNIQVQGTSICRSDSQLEITNSFSFSHNQALVHDLIPSQTLISLLNNTITNWTCDLSLSFHILNEGNLRVRFLNKKLVRTEIPAQDILYQSNTIPFSNGQLREVDMKNVTLQNNNAFQSAELLCENFSSTITSTNSVPISADDLSQNAKKNIYKKTLLDPRMQIPQQSCIFRLHNGHKYIYSYRLNLLFKIPKPEFSCRIHKRPLHGKNAYHQNVASIYYKNNYNFPLTFARDLTLNKIYASVRWESGTREHDAVWERGELLSVDLGITYPYRKTFGNYEYYWLPPGEAVEIKMNMRAPDRKNVIVNILHLDEICRLYGVNFSADTFEEMIGSSRYDDPN